MVEVEVLKGEKRDGKSGESKKKKRRRRRKKDLERDLVKSEKPRFQPVYRVICSLIPGGTFYGAKIQGSRRFLNSFRKPGQIYFAYEYDFIPLPPFSSPLFLAFNLFPVVLVRLTRIS